MRTATDQREEKEDRGQEDEEGEDAATEMNKSGSYESPVVETTPNEDLFAETEALLRELDSLAFGEEEESSVPSTTKEMSSETASGAQTPLEGKDEQAERSPLCKSSLLIFLQLVLSTIRHVQRPASKLVALRLIERLARYSSDEARLQRIVPVTVSLLQDQDPLSLIPLFRCRPSTTLPSLCPP